MGNAAVAYPLESGEFKRRNYSVRYPKLGKPQVLCERCSFLVFSFLFSQMDFKDEAEKFCLIVFDKEKNWGIVV